MRPALTPATPCLGRLRSRASLVVVASTAVVGLVASPPRAVAAPMVATVIDLGTLPGGTASIAFAANDSGQVLGNSDAPHQAPHAVLWTHTGHRPVAIT